MISWQFQKKTWLGNEKDEQDWGSCREEDSYPKFQKQSRKWNNVRKPVCGFSDMHLIIFSRGQQHIAHGPNLAHQARGLCLCPCRDWQVRSCTGARPLPLLSLTSFILGCGMGTASSLCEAAPGPGSFQLHSCYSPELGAWGEAIV